MNSTLRAFATILLLSASLGAWSAGPAAGGESNPQSIVHLLDYVAV